MFPVVLCVMVSVVAHAEGNGLWPEIRPLHREIVVDDVATGPKVVIPLVDTAGRPQYELRCWSADAASGGGRLYTADYECYLEEMRAGRATGRNLIAMNPLDEGHRDNGGRFLADETCAARQDCSAQIDLRVRGMKVRLGLRDVRAGKDDGRGFFYRRLTLVVDVTRDPSAITTIAAATRQPRAPALSRYPEIPVQNWTVTMPPGIVEIPVKDSAGEIAYTIRCANSVDRHRGEDVLSDARGGIACGLHATREDEAENLIGTRDPVTLHSRSDFGLHQLVSGCAAYPDWGKRREFRLRGMVVTFDIDATFVALDPPKPWLWVSRALIKVRVEPDPKATCPIAAAATFADWRAAAPDRTSCGEPVPRWRGTPACPMP